MSLPSRYAAGIIDSFIRLEMKSPGGKAETLMLLKSHEGSGSKRILILRQQRQKSSSPQRQQTRSPNGNWRALKLVKAHTESIGFSPNNTAGANRPETIEAQLEYLR